MGVVLASGFTQQSIFAGGYVGCAPMTECGACFGSGRRTGADPGYEQYRDYCSKCQGLGKVWVPWGEIPATRRR